MINSLHATLDLPFGWKQRLRPLNVRGAGQDCRHGRLPVWPSPVLTREALFKPPTPLRSTGRLLKRTRGTEWWPSGGTRAISRRANLHYYCLNKGRQTAARSTSGPSAEIDYSNAHPFFHSSAIICELKGVGSALVLTLILACKCEQKRCFLL